MKKKILVLIGLVMLTTGCNATINVNIDKENINQKYIISMSSSEISNGTVYKTIEQNLLDKEFDSEVLSYFTINNNINSNPLKASRTYRMQMSDYSLGMSMRNWDVKGKRLRAETVWMKHTEGFDT